MISASLILVLTVWQPVAAEGGPATAGQLMVRADPGLEAPFLLTVHWTLRSLPPSVLEELSERGWRIELVPSLGQALPELADEAPRGWPSGWTWKEVDAAHLPSERRLIVAAYRRTRTGERVRATRTAQVIRHELGHAWDVAGAGQRLRSSEESFRAAYELDRKTMSATERDRLGYFLQAGTKGRQEAFAEAFALVHGGGSAVELQDEFRSGFPRVVEWMGRAVGRPAPSDEPLASRRPARP